MTNERLWRVCWRTFRCAIGLHYWVQSRPLTGYDAFPFHGDRGYSTPTRYCTKCNRTQRWLPGYGGNELGCWMPCTAPAADNE